MSSQGQIQYLFSHRTEQLVSRFIDNITGEIRDRQDPFFAPLVLVPNPSVSTYLKHEIVSREEITANIEFTYLERFLLKNAGIETKAAEIGDITLKIAAFFTDEKNKNNYLIKAAEGSSRSGADIAHESRRLARLFLDYERSRPEIIENWESEKELYNTGSERNRESTRKIAAAEREIYNYVFNNSENDESFISSRELFRNAGFIPEKRIIHIFAITHFSELYATILKKLALNNHIIFYHLNPFCLNAGETPDMKYFTDEDALKENSSELTYAWGATLAGQYQILSDGLDKKVKTEIEILASDRNETENKRTAGNLLHFLQKQLVGAEIEKPTGQDNSLQIFSARGIYREVETIHNHIKHLLQSVDNLKVDDILILLPDISKYSPVIDYVFNAENGNRLYVNLLESETGRDTELIKAFTLLSDMVLDDITREKFIEYAGTQTIQNAYGIDNDDTEVFLKVIDYLNIYRENVTDYAPVFSWSKGLQRLRLSVLFSNVINSESSIFTDGLPDGLHLLTEEQLMKFNLLVSDLLSIRDRYRKSRHLKAWAVELNNLFENILPADESDRLESAVSRQLTVVLNRLTGITEHDPENAADSYSFSFIRTYLLDELSEVKAGRGRYRAGGITVSTFRPMRPVPFRVIYMAGLNESDFPGSEKFNRLDLSNRYKRKGDLTARESNEYLFLETLLCARDRLVLSYRGRDETQDREFLPSPLVQRLKLTLNEILNDAAEAGRKPVEGDINSEADFIIPETPVRPDSSYYFSEQFIKKYNAQITDLFIAPAASDRQAENQLQVVQFNRDYAEAARKRALIAAGEEPSEKSDEVSHSSVSLFEAQPETQKEGDVEEIEISLYDLFEYLKDPALHRLKKDYNIDTQKPVFSEEKVLEPFMPENRDFTGIYKSILTDVFTGKDLPGSVEQMMSVIKAKAQQTGEYPFLAGWEINKTEKMKDIRKYIEYINEHLINKKLLQKYSRVFLTENNVKPDNQISFKPYLVELENNNRNYLVKLKGYTDFIAIDDENLHLYSLYNTGFKNNLPEYSVQNYIYLYLLNQNFQRECILYHHPLAGKYEQSNKKYGYEKGDYKNLLRVDHTGIKALNKSLSEWLSNLVYDYLFETDYIEVPYQLFIEKKPPYDSKVEIEKILSEVDHRNKSLRTEPVNLQKLNIIKTELHKIYEKRIQPLNIIEEVFKKCLKI